MGRRCEEYAVYKGDKLLCMGTAKECGGILNVTPDYVQWMITPTYQQRLAKRKNPERCTVAIRI